MEGKSLELQYEKHTRNMVDKTHFVDVNQMPWKVGCVCFGDKEWMVGILYQEAPLRSSSVYSHLAVVSSS
jgi:hypothetical protein